MISVASYRSASSALPPNACACSTAISYARARVCSHNSVRIEISPPRICCSTAPNRPTSERGAHRDPADKAEHLDHVVAVERDGRGRVEARATAQMLASRTPSRYPRLPPVPLARLVLIFHRGRLRLAFPADLRIARHHGLEPDPLQLPRSPPRAAGRWRGRARRAASGADGRANRTPRTTAGSGAGRPRRRHRRARPACC